MVTIEPTKHYDGRLSYRSLLSRVDLEFESNRDRKRRNDGRIEDQILIALAGPFAQRRYAPRSDWKPGAGIVDRSIMHGGTDYDFVGDLIFRRYRNDDVSRAYWRYVEARAKSFVDRHWTEIDAVARCLFERGTISHDELVEAAYAHLRLRKVTLSQ